MKTTSDKIPIEVSEAFKTYKKEMEKFRKTINEIVIWSDSIVGSITKSGEIPKELLKRKISHYSTDLRKIIEYIFFAPLSINRKNYNKKMRKMAYTHDKKNDFLKEIEKIDKEYFPEKMIISGPKNEHWIFSEEWNNFSRENIIKLYKVLSKNIHSQLFDNENDENKYCIDGLVNMREATNYLKHSLSTHILNLFNTDYVFFICISETKTSGNIFSKSGRYPSEKLNLNLESLKNKELELKKKDANDWNEHQKLLSCARDALYHLFLENKQEKN
ncbi:MAG: hypothetical protein ACRC1F_01780 [Metamycoplasmataceae bacterium]